MLDIIIVLYLIAMAGWTYMQLLRLSNINKNKPIAAIVMFITTIQKIIWVIFWLHIEYTIYKRYTQIVLIVLFCVIYNIQLYLTRNKDKITNLLDTNPIQKIFIFEQISIIALFIPIFIFYM